jgi:hypothetical protein
MDRGIFSYAGPRPKQDRLDIGCEKSQQSFIPHNAAFDCLYLFFIQQHQQRKPL